MRRASILRARLTEDLVGIWDVVTVNHVPLTTAELYFEFESTLTGLRCLGARGAQ
jgi:hypothetical protein